MTIVVTSEVEVCSEVSVPTLRAGRGQQEPIQGIVQRGLPVGSAVKNLPALHKMQV